ncbi:MAG: hypothetical protein QME87_12435 [Bacillota bacterium]|nr:hypothetical protein [Bacillota bacterium]
MAFVVASALWCKIGVRSGWLDGVLGWQLGAWVFGGAVGICLAQNRRKRRALSNEGVSLVGVVWVAGMDLLVLFGPLSGEAVYAVLGGGSLVLTYVLARFVGSRSVSAEEWKLAASSERLAFMP